MKNVITLPVSNSPVHYASRLKTAGSEWTTHEKKLLDTAEFLEAMIIVLNDVKIKNIKERDYAMAQIVTEEIKNYEARLDVTTNELTSHRQNYITSVQ